MRIEPNYEVIRESMEKCAALFGGTAWCTSARNYHSGWGYLVIAYDDSEGSHIDVKVFPGQGGMPADPIRVAQDLLGLSEDAVNGLCSPGTPRPTTEDYNRADAPYVDYGAWAPAGTRSASELRGIILKVARARR